MNAPGPYGPFETESQVLALPDVQAVFEAAHASNRHGVMAEGGNALLVSACADAGIEPGEYEARIIRWLADFGPQACAVFADLIRRAAQAGLRLHEDTDMEVLADVWTRDGDTWLRCDNGVPAATLRRVGWLDQQGRVWTAKPPPEAGDSLMPLLVDAREDS